MTTQQIYCVQCGRDVAARSTNGAEIYPHRPDLAHKIFWKCDGCGNYVGTHPENGGKKLAGQPLGNIPTPELRNARNHIHRLLDPIWKGRHMSRKHIYGSLSNRLGYEYHTGETKSLEECRKIYRIIQEIVEEKKAS